jgi:parallel beta-helix repeat protein
MGMKKEKIAGKVVGSALVALMIGLVFVTMVVPVTAKTLPDSNSITQTTINLRDTIPMTNLSKLQIIQQNGHSIIKSEESDFDSVIYTRNNATYSVIASNNDSFDSNVLILEDNKIPVIIQLEEVPLLEYKTELSMFYLKTVDTPINKTEEILINATEMEALKSAIISYANTVEYTHTLVKSEIKQANINITLKREFKNVFNGFSADIFRSDIEKIKNLPHVKAVYPDSVVSIALQDGVPLINATEVWQMKDSNNKFVTGENITVAIIDTGIDYTHPDLGGGFGPSYKVIGGYDIYNDDSDPMDDNGHGTHCAGIVAANGTLKGVAPSAKLMAYKVLSSGGSGWSSDVIAGVEMATDPDGDPNTDDGADVISMSLGGRGKPDDPTSQTVDTASDAGTVVVVAAGNSGPSSSTIDSPGCARKAITVGASDKNDVIARFSSRGPVVWNDEVLIKPDVLAPGVSINSTVPNASVQLGSNTGYKYLSGTSMATPHVAGASALLLQLHPDWIPERVKASIMNTAVDLNYDVYTQGAGRIDAYEAANAEALVVPSSLSLGLDNLSENMWSVNRTLELTNVAKSQKTYNISIQMTAQQGINTTLSKTSIILNTNETDTFNFNLSVDNSVVPNGDYEGNIFVQSNSETLRIPFAFLKKSALKLVFSEEPWTVLIHNRHNFSKFLAYPGNSSTLLLDDGLYDIMTTFDPDTFVVKEGVNVVGRTEASINRNEAINRMEITAIDENGNEFYPKSGNVFFGHNDSGIGQGFFGSFGRIKYFSNVSNAYNLDWVMTDQSDKMYIINGFIRNGISQDITFENTPDNYRNIEVTFHPNILTQEILPIYWISHLDTWWAIGTASYGSGMELQQPFTQDLHAIPIPCSDFYWNAIQIELRNGNYSENSFLYKTPYLFIKNNSIERSLFPLGSTLSSLNTTKIHIGLNPEQWFGKFDNYNNEIRLKAYKGSFIWIFLTQMYDMSPHDNLPYRLYKDGKLMGNGTFKGVGNLWYSPFYVNIPLNTSGKYSLLITKNYSINGINRTALVNATFNTSKSDKNPPSLTSLNLISNGELTDIIRISGDNKLNFSVDPIGGSINSVFAYYNTSNEWIQLSLTNDGLNYSAQIIPTGLNSANCSFKIVVVDDSFNSLEYQFQVPTTLPVHNLNTNLNYSTIQEAIDAPETLDGHTISVDAGTYHENVVVNKSLTLQGENKNTTIIDSGGNRDVVNITADNCSICGFTMRNSGMFWSDSGIQIFKSNNNKIFDNIVLNNHCGIRLWDHSHTNNLSNNNVSNNDCGILLLYSYDNYLSNNTANSNIRFGIDLGSSDRNNISNNIAMNNYYSGIVLWESGDNTIISNNLQNNGWNPSTIWRGGGIDLKFSNNNFIKNNNISNNNNSGIYINQSSSNNITDNKVCNNSYGIQLSSSNNTKIYHNNIFNNTNQASDNTGNNSWDDGYPSGGNYWSDYTGVDLYHGPYQNLTGSDGIGDTPYMNIAAELLEFPPPPPLVVDNYPLMNPYIENIVTISGPIEINASPKSLPANGISTSNITIAVFWPKIEDYPELGDIEGYESISGTPAAHTSVLVGTTLGKLTDAEDMNSTGKDVTVFTGDSGVASVLLSGNETGVADISAKATGITDLMNEILANETTVYVVENSTTVTFLAAAVFDTGSSANPYPSIMGNHTGTITPNADITVSKLYTYSCAGTGGHTESIKLYENGDLIANGTWNGYKGDWHNITLHNLTGGTPYVTLSENHEYNYTIITGSYPQIHHNTSLLTANGWINCTQFIDANGRKYNNLIPAIRLWT